MYRTILLAYDGTREGRLALREGALLAKMFHSEVVLMAVVEPAFVPLAVDAGVGYFEEDRGAEYLRVLEEGADRLRKLGLPYKTTFRRGEPVTCIIAAAEEFHADLVVVGHHKKGRFARWIQQSVTAELIDRLECSVLSGHLEISDEELFGDAR